VKSPRRCSARSAHDSPANISIGTKALALSFHYCELFILPPDHPLSLLASFSRGESSASSLLQFFRPNQPRFDAFSPPLTLPCTRSDLHLFWWWPQILGILGPPPRLQGTERATGASFPPFLDQFRSCVLRCVYRGFVLPSRGLSFSWVRSLADFWPLVLLNKETSLIG